MKKIALRVVSLLLVILMFISVTDMASLSAQAATSSTKLGITVTYCQDDARDMLSDLNSFRTDKSGKAWYWNSNNSKKTVFNTSGNTVLNELKYDYALEAVAMQRAVEIAVCFDHTRPNGNSWTTAYPSDYTYSCKGENLVAGYEVDAAKALELWKETDCDYSGQGHRRNMLNSNYKAVGIAHVKYDGYDYWVQEFGAPCSSAAKTTANNSKKTVNVSIVSSKIKSTSIAIENDTYMLEIGKSLQPRVTASLSVANHVPSSWKVVGTLSGATLTSGTTSVATVSSGKITGKAAGVSTITAKYGSSNDTASVIVCKSKMNDITLKASSASYNSIKLTWSAVYGVDGYEIYRSTSSNGTYSSVTKISGASTITYTNKSLNTGTTYYYKIRAYKLVDGEKNYGAYSPVCSETPSLGAAKLSSVSSVSHTSVQLKWTAVSGANGYVIYRATSSKGTYTAVKTIASGTTVSYKDTGLSCNKTYYYKIRAYRLVNNKKVYGGYSSVISVKPKPAKPTISKIVKKSSGKIKLTWGKISGVSGYEIYRATSSSGSYKKVKTITSASTVTYTNTGLKKGKKYYYKVRAYKKISGKKYYGSFSAVKNAKA